MAERVGVRRTNAKSAAGGEGDAMRGSRVGKPETRFSNRPREVRGGEDSLQVTPCERSAHAVALAKGADDRLAKRKPSLVEFLSASPLAGVELQIERDRSSPREFDL